LFYSKCVKLIYNTGGENVQIGDGCNTWKCAVGNKVTGSSMGYI